MSLWVVLILPTLELSWLCYALKCLFWCHTYSYMCKLVVVSLTRYSYL